MSPALNDQQRDHHDICERPSVPPYTGAQLSSVGFAAPIPSSSFNKEPPLGPLRQIAQEDLLFVSFTRVQRIARVSGRGSNFRAAFNASGSTHKLSESDFAVEDSSLIE